ncbi:MAG: D-glycero-beta-D-manno-heptose 1,7-bisphosphate 7-phosphatase [Pseudomonadota bacterium]
MFKLILLDRDGVINEDSPDYIKSVAEWRPIPGALETIAALCHAGYAVGVCTNQAGIGRGILSHDALQSIHEHLQERLAERDCALATLEFCPHHPDDGCVCRKPRPGMLCKALVDLGVPAAHACFVGDSRKDLLAAWAAGVQPVLVRTGNGDATAAALPETPAGAMAPLVFDDLAAFGRSLLGDLDPSN